MTTTEEIMKYESILPEDFDGVFRFSNFSDEDFIAVWNKKEYLFPAQSTVPMVMPEHSPIEIQHIRKHFAKKLAEREFFKGENYKTKASQEGTPGNRTMSGIHQAATYNLDELAPLIQKCLIPLKDAKLTSKPVQAQSIEDKLTRDDQGRLNSEAIDGKSSLKAKALNS
jgi:hypothetical protein